MAICIDFVGCVTRLCFFSSSSYGSAIWTSVSLFLINFNLINASKGFPTYTHSLLYVSWYICITVKHGYKNNEFMVTAKVVYSHNCKSLIYCHQHFATMVFDSNRIQSKWCHNNVWSLYIQKLMLAGNLSSSCQNVEISI